MLDASDEAGTGLYFAYGTLMDTEEMHKYCPTASGVAVAGLAHHRLEFWSYSDVSEGVGCQLVRAQGETAYGVVYRVPCAELDDLDRASGVDKGRYRRSPVELVKLDGTPLRATTYFLTQPIAHARPSDSYAGLVASGMKQTSGLPRAFVTRLEHYLRTLAWPARDESTDQ